MWWSWTWQFELRQKQQCCWWERVRRKTDNTDTQSRAGEAALWSNHLWPAPPPVWGAYGVWRKREAGWCRRRGGQQIKSLCGSRAPVDKDTAATCSISSYSEWSPGPSPLKQERPGHSSSCLHPPLPHILHGLKEHLLCSHAWMLGWGEWQGRLCEGGMFTVMSSSVCESLFGYGDTFCLTACVCIKISNLFLICLKKF